MKKGITPVISTILLLVITIALVGIAVTYFQTVMVGPIGKSFEIPTGGSYCQNGVIKIYIRNTAYQSSLAPGDFIISDVNGNVTSLYGLPLPEGQATLLVNHTCCGNPAATQGCCGTGYYTVNLGTSSMAVHPRIYCP
jgi:flagellin-like protein